VATFEKLWATLVPEPYWQPRLYLPFYHLSTEKDPFWHIQSEGGLGDILTSSYSPKSLHALNSVVAFAYLNHTVFELFINAESRRFINQALLDKFFPNRSFDQSKLIHDRKSYLLDIEEEFLGKKKVAAESEIQYETRSSVFKSQVPKVYGYQCAISGLRVSAKTSISMVDACHIQPWHIAHNDTIQNGICLTPTLHRAFDRGLISISPDYRVLLADKEFDEDRNSTYALSQFVRQPLKLPTDPQLAPSQELIEWHRSKFGF
jgi:putative restriction endonuclease